MRKLLLSIVTLFAAVSSQAAIGDDLTGKYLQNADFSQGDVIDSGICTYDKDMETNETKYFGQQEVAGWTAFSLSTNTYEAPGLGDASPNRAASAIYAFNDEVSEDDDVIFLGGKGFLAPFMNSADEEAGRFLGLVAVWGGTAQYTQTVTLPAGCYTLTFKTYNGAGTGAVSSNLFGFIADGGKAYTCATTAFGETGTWFDQEVTFILDQETSGVISVGYTSANAGSSAMPHLFIESVKLTEGDPQVILGPMIDAAKDELLVLLEDGDELGVDTRAGWAVYNDDNATLEQVNEAIANQKATNEKGMTDFTDYFINNAHFSQGTPLDAGVCTYDYDMPGNNTKYFGMQPIEKWTASSPSDNVQLMANSGSTPANPLNSRASGLFAVGSADSIWLGSVQDKVPATKASGATEGNVFGFISVWTGTAYYSQHVTLPAGSYTITIPTYNERGTGAISKNMCGFIADNGMEYLAETKTFTVGKWENETIKFTLDEDTPGIITIGYVAANAGSGSMPHLFVDEFLLKYNGTIEESPSLIALRGAVSSAEEFEAICEASIKDSLEKAIEAGAELVSANSKDDDANIKAATAINNLMIEANASAAVYAKFIAFIEGEMANTYEKYKDGELSEFANELTELIDTYTGAYEDGEYTTGQINEAMSSFKAQVVAAVKEALATAAADGKEHSLDVSALFTNIDYAKSTVEGWQNETGTTAFLSRVQTAEVWNQSNFNVYQTLAEMPAGAYEISVNGFYRSAANVDNYAEWQDEDVVGQAYLYAGGNKVLMHNVAEYAAEKDDNHTAAADDADAELATLFVPNSNANANYIFYTDGEAVNKVTTALLEEGDLTIGIKGENLESNAWVVWGGFTVTYKGVSDELIKAAVNNEIEGLIEQATAMLDDEYVAAVDKNNDQINDAVEGGQDAIKSESIEEKSAAIASLKEAMEYASKSEALLQKLVSMVDAYTTIVENAELDYTKEPLQDMLDEIGDPVEDGVPSNEKVQEWIDAIPGAWIAQVCATVGLDKATEAAPVEITPAIINADFEGADGATPGASYWSVTKDGGNEGYQFGIYEFYDNNSCDIHQTIEGLIPGYYRVMVQGFYRAGGNEANVASMTETPDSINHAQLYANDRAVNLKNVLDLEDVEDEDYVAGAGLGVGSEPVVTWKENEEFHVPNNREALAAYFELGLYSNQIDCQVTEDGKLTLGIKKEAHVGTDWLPYDNFQLFYLGTAQPTAVEGVVVEAQAAKAIYDLQGRKVSKAQKGLYIMNGKVVIVK